MDFTASTGIILASIIALGILAVVCYQVYTSYRYTRKKYLLNFLGGFILLGLTYGIILVFGNNEANYPARLVLRGFAYVLIALSYSYASKHALVTKLLLGLVAVQAVVMSIYILPILDFLNPTIDAATAVANMVVIFYIINRTIVSPIRTKQTNYVTYAFILFLLTEYTGLIHSIQVIDYVTYIALAIRTIALAFCLLAVRTTQLDTQRVLASQLVASRREPSGA